jgi:hypothetical protein
MTSADKFIYFMKPVGLAGPIKIGFSKNPMKRLLSCAAWSPFPLEVLATANGDRTIERQLHNCFADVHSHGEWFHPHERLLSAVKAIKAGAAVAEAVNLSDARGNTLVNAQMATRVKKGTVGKTRWNRANWQDDQERAPRTGDAA